MKCWIRSTTDVWTTSPGGTSRIRPMHICGGGGEILLLVFWWTKAEYEFTGCMCMQFVFSMVFMHHSYSSAEVACFVFYFDCAVPVSAVHKTESQVLPRVNAISRCSSWTSSPAVIVALDTVTHAVTESCSSVVGPSHKQSIQTKGASAHGATSDDLATRETIWSLKLTFPDQLSASWWWLQEQIGHKWGVAPETLLWLLACRLPHLYTLMTTTTCWLPKPSQSD